ncbi:hypothetical protein GLP37_21520 [Photobacterium phosphoreum]|uniref:hypothetical protein n=1 Tax=Photobacterium phosphoreum TaxID=659 RepID=UPI001E2DDD65|nr:hypothetical protein [Photobacterium phosphoreum]MCD9504745.1 hypothetical protein [Photobacterium phosphoreum]
MAERDAKGRFIAGNQAARTHGGYATRVPEYGLVVHYLRNDKQLSPRLQTVYQKMIAFGLLDECAITDQSAQLDCALSADHDTDNESHSVTLRN